MFELACIKILPQLPNWAFNADANTGHGQHWCPARFALRRRLAWALNSPIPHAIHRHPQILARRPGLWLH